MEREPLVDVGIPQKRWAVRFLRQALPGTKHSLLTGNFPNNYNFSSADLFVVPASILPVPEPGTGLLAFTTGLLLLVFSHKRQRL